MPLASSLLTIDGSCISECCCSLRVKLVSRLVRKGFEQKQGRVSDEEWPDEPLIEKRLQEVEQGVLHAEPLEEVASKAECEDEEDHPVADRRGIVRLRRKVVMVPAPRNSEEVRRRIRLLAATFDVAKMRNPNKAFLQDLTADTWEQHVRYFLVGKVANFRFPTQLGKKGPCPSRSGKRQSRWSLMTASL